jgi:hypothetical protein
VGTAFLYCRKTTFSKIFLPASVNDVYYPKMSAQQRVALWAAEPDLDDEINDVDIPLAIPSYPNADMYEDPNVQLDESALLATQAQIAQQAAFAQIPDIVKRVSDLIR